MTTIEPIWQVVDLISDNYIICSDYRAEDMDWKVVKGSY
jgi:hypothetical protein